MAQVNFILHSLSVLLWKKLVRMGHWYSWNGQYCFGEQWQSFCDFHQAKTSSTAIDKHLYSWISLSPVSLKWTCFDSMSFLPFSMELETRQTHRWMLGLLPHSFHLNYYRSFLPFSMELETGQTHRWMLPHSFHLNYYSPAVAVHLYVYPLLETVSEKLLCFGRLRNLDDGQVTLSRIKATLQ